MSAKRLLKDIVSKRFLFLVLVFFIIFLKEKIKNFRCFCDSTADLKTPLKRIRQAEDSNVGETGVRYETESEFIKRMSQRMVARHRRLKSVCNSLGLYEKPFHKQVLMEAKRYNFVYCRVPKAGSTNMDRVFNQLVKEKEYLGIDLKAIKRTDAHRVEFITSRSFSLKELENMMSLIVVRDPLARMVSAYVMKVLNKGKNPNGEISGTWLSNLAIPMNLTFSGFIEHLISHPGPFSTFDRHWALYVELCQPCHIRYQVIAQLETINEDMRYFFTLVGAPRNITFLHGASPDGRSNTNEERIRHYFSTVDNERLRLLYDLYKPDFDLFGYSLREFDFVTKAQVN